MFTGIVKAVGRIVDDRAVDGDRRLGVEISSGKFPALEPGASVAVNGVCLTAVETAAARFAADVSLETLTRTNLGTLGLGALVNLEPATRLGDPLDGHLVSGHVDAVARVLALEPSARSTRIRIELPRPLAKYVAPQGSIAVDGVSLTVNAVDAGAFEVNIIPHTLVHTRIHEYRPGSAVNIEIDLLARYVERLSSTDSADGITLERLRSLGYAGTN
jgi:riboflavin synthase